MSSQTATIKMNSRFGRITRRILVMHKGWRRLLLVVYFGGWIPVLLVMDGAGGFNDEDFVGIPILWAVLFWPIVRTILWIRDGFAEEGG